MLDIAKQLEKSFFLTAFKGGAFGGPMAEICPNQPADGAECGELLGLPDQESFWYQCPNCGCIFHAEDSDSDFVDYHFYMPDSSRLDNPPPVVEPVPQAVSYGNVNDPVQKAANFGALAGQVIAGNLARGGDGKFTSAGNADSGNKDDNTGKPLSAADITSRLHAPPKGKGGKGKKPAKAKAPKKTPEEKAAELAKKKADNVLEVTKNISDDTIGEIFSLADDPMDPGPALNDEGKKYLVDNGLAKAHDDGTVELNGAGRTLVRAMQSGNLKRSEQVLKGAKSTATDQSNRRNEQAQALRDRADKIAAGKKKKEADASYGHGPTGLFSAPGVGSGIYNAMQMPGRANRKFGKNRKAKTITFSSGVKEISGNFSVYRSKEGGYRWVGLSSNGYQDRDGQHVARSALERDVARADQDKNFGELDWWHVPGMYIGHCDYNAMHDGFLIESGPLASKEIAEALAKSPIPLGLSIEFEHPINEPDADGVFHNIRRKRRAVLPLTAASNIFTSFQIEGVNMLDTKMAEFKSLFPTQADADAVLEKVISQTLDAARFAEKNKITSKAAGDPPPAAAPSDEGQPDPDAADEAAEETEYVGDMTVADLESTIQEVVTQVLTAAGIMAKEAKEAKEPAWVATFKSSVVSEVAGKVSEALRPLDARLKQTEATVKTLNSDRPRRAITDRENIVDQKERQIVDPGIDQLDELDRIAADVVKTW